MNKSPWFWACWTEQQKHVCKPPVDFVSAQGACQWIPAFNWALIVLMCGMVSYHTRVLWIPVLWHLQPVQKSCNHSPSLHFISCSMKSSSLFSIPVYIFTMFLCATMHHTPVCNLCDIPACWSTTFLFMTLQCILQFQLSLLTQLSLSLLVHLVPYLFPLFHATTMTLYHWSQKMLTHTPCTNCICSVNFVILSIFSLQDTHHHIRTVMLTMLKSMHLWVWDAHGNLSAHPRTWFATHSSHQWHLVFHEK